MELEFYFALTLRLILYNYCFAIRKYILISARPINSPISGSILLDYFYTGYNLDFPIYGILTKKILLRVISWKRPLFWLGAFLSAVVEAPPTLAYTGWLWLHRRPVLADYFYGSLQFHFFSFRYFVALCIIFLDFFLTDIFFICSWINSYLFLATFHLF